MGKLEKKKNIYCFVTTDIATKADSLSVSVTISVLFSPSVCLDDI